MPDPEDIESLKRRAAAIASVPAFVRNARKFADGFEERAVRRTCNWIGQPFGPLYEAMKRSGDASPGFKHLHAAAPDLPIRFAAGRLRFDFAGIARELFNDFARSPMMCAFGEARAVTPEGTPLAVVFAWPGVRKCQGLCAIHDVGSLGGSEVGTRIIRAVRGVTLTIEPVPSLLDSLGLLAGTGDDEEDEKGQAS